MSKTKSAGSTRLGRDSNAQYLGIKRNQGQQVSAGEILLRQRGSRCLAGVNVGMGKDHTLFALKAGRVSFKERNKTTFTGSKRKAKVVEVI